MSLVDAFLLDPALFEIWVAERTDGIHGSGTNSDPFNGSTQERFDAVMDKFSTQENVTIRLGPGTFLTKGYADGETSEEKRGWQARPGMKIRGSGMDVTTLKLVNVSPDSPKHFFAVGHPLTTVVDGFEISDLSIDCNTTDAENAACGGVRIMGNHARIYRVKVKGWGTKSADVPCFGLSVLTAYADGGISEIASAGIEACVAIEPYRENAAVITALNAGGPEDSEFTKEGHGKSPYIRDCFVDCSDPDPENPEPFPHPDPEIDTGKYRGISMGWCRGGVIEGNHVHNADIGGPYQDQRSVRDLIIRNNFFKNVARAVYLNLGQLGSSLSTSANLVASDGMVATISGGSLNVTSLGVGDRVSIVTNQANPPSPAFTGVYQVVSVQSSPSAQFTIRTSLTGSATVTVKKLFSVSRAIVEGNTVELAEESGVVAISVFDNNDDAPYLEPPDHAHGDVIVRNNKIRYVDGAPPNDSGTATRLIELSGAKNVIVKDNVLDTIAETPLINQRCGNATYFNNKKPNGVLIQGKESGASGKYEELETDNEFALVMSMFMSRRSH